MPNRVKNRWKLNDHCTRYELEDDFFIDRETVKPLQDSGYLYGVYKSGAGAFTSNYDGKTYRIAGYIGGADTLKAALAIAEGGTNARVS